MHSVHHCKDIAASQLQLTLGRRYVQASPGMYGGPIEGLSEGFENSLNLSIFYGSNKGGVSCANGICRYYPGFSDGFRMQLTKSFY